MNTLPHFTGFLWKKKKERKRGGGVETPARRKPTTAHTTSPTDGVGTRNGESSVVGHPISISPIIQPDRRKCVKPPPHKTQPDSTQTGIPNAVLGAGSHSSVRKPLVQVRAKPRPWRASKAGYDHLTVKTYFWIFWMSHLENLRSLPGGG